MIFSLTKRLEADMAAAKSYEEWKEAALAHDEETGVNAWKKSDESSISTTSRSAAGCGALNA